MKKKILYHFATDRNGGEFRRIKRLANDYDLKYSYHTLEVVILPVFFLFSGFRFRKTKLGSEFLYLPIIFPFARFKIIRCLNKFLLSAFSRIINSFYKPALVWGETHLAYPAVQYGNFRKIIDIHGAYPEELEYIGANKKVIEEFHITEKEIIKTVNTLIVQSETMKNHLLDKMDGHIEKEIIVYQCGVDTDKFDYNNTHQEITRKHLGYVESDILFIYVGGLHKWQMIYETLEIFKTFSDNENINYLILSQDNPAPIFDFCNKNDIKRVKVLNKVPHDQVSAYMALSDIAWLTREDVILNKVASPTKLGEYLACGLPVIVGNVSENWPWVNNNEALFCIVDYKDIPDANQRITNFLQIPRDKEIIRNIAIEQLSSLRDYNSL